MGPAKSVFTRVFDALWPDPLAGTTGARLCERATARCYASLLNVERLGAGGLT